MTATTALTIQFFHDHFLRLDSSPFGSNLFNGFAPSHNILGDVLYCEETVAILRRSDKEIGVVRHWRPGLVVGDISEWWSVVWRRSTSGCLRVFDHLLFIS